MREIEIFVVCCTLAFAGCSSKANDGTKDDAGVMPDAGGGSDAANVTDMGSDAATADAGVDMTLPDFGPSMYQHFGEVEPNTQPADATQFAVPGLIEGDVDKDTDPVDWWSVILPGSSIMEISIDYGDVPWIDVQAPDASKRAMHGGAGDSREFFIPTANRYQIGVLANDQNPKYHYRIIVRKYDAVPVPLDGTSVSGDLNDGKVDVYSWTAPSSGFTVAEVFAQRDPIGSNLDSYLIVQDHTLETFDSNDDATPGTNDSQLDFNARSGAEYWIAVDMYEPGDGGDRSYRLDITPN